MFTKKMNLSLVYFMMLITILFLLLGCSHGQTNPIRLLEVTLNDETTVYDVTDNPVTLFFQTNDTVTFRAIVQAPYVFNGWSGIYGGTENPFTQVINAPGNLTIGYVIALSFEMSLENSEFIDNKTFEFDVLIRSYTETFLLTAYQVSMDISNAITGTLAFNYIAGSSELNNIPSAAIGVFNREIAFAVGSPGNDSIDTVQKRIGRFRLTSSEDFPFIQMGIFFDFDGSVNTIMTGENLTDITALGTYINLAERHKVKVIVN